MPIGLNSSEVQSVYGDMNEAITGVGATAANAMSSR